MKHLLTTLLCAAACLLPGHAAEPSNLLKVGKTFEFKVKSMVSSKTDGSGFTPSGVPIPAGIPKYKIGKAITFKITKGNHLEWPDRSLPLYGDYDGYYSYSKLQTVEKPYPDVATVYVNAKDKPTGVMIYFYKKKASGAIHTVEYQLE